MIPAKPSPSDVLDSLKEPVQSLDMAPTFAFSDIYILFYRHGNNPQTQSLHFGFNGNLKQAINRGRNYCDNVGWRFVMVRPFLINLDEEEKKSAREG